MIVIARLLLVAFVFDYTVLIIGTAISNVDTKSATRLLEIHQLVSGRDKLKPVPMTSVRQSYTITVSYRCQANTSS